MLRVSGVDNAYLPVVIDKKKGEDLKIFNDLIASNTGLIVLDHFASQKKELFKIQNPRKVVSAEALDQLYHDWKQDRNIENEGVWVFYPWSSRLIHILDKEEFISLRTARNHYKISPAEQKSLAAKKIGIIGLSVGNAVAVSLAVERGVGKFKLADYDTVELSNLNRLKTGLHNIGLNKCVITAREIFEIDPFLEVECYLDGLNNENIHRFLLDDGKLDLLIDECDDLNIKILCRNLSKKYAIPVVMETSDRGMLDVERFDLEPERPILHGFLKDIPEEQLVNITPEFRFPLVMRIIDVMNSSTRLRTSLLEMGQTVNTWPQLASAVALGGAVVTDVTRRIFLGQFTDSGRFYVDLEKIIHNQPDAQTPQQLPVSAPEFDIQNAIRIADSLVHSELSVAPPTDHIEEIVRAGSQAPSSGNDQPWKWVFRNNSLLLFHDVLRSASFSNYENRMSDMALGAAFENAMLKSTRLGWKVSSTVSPDPAALDLFAIIQFFNPDFAGADTVYAPDLADAIDVRSTARQNGSATPLSQEEYSALIQTAESVHGAKLHFLTDSTALSQMGQIVGECERLRILNTEGHQEFFERQIRWNPDESGHDGINIAAMGIGPPLVNALPLLRDKKIAAALKAIGGGSSLIENTRKALEGASCIAVMSLPQTTRQKYFQGGIAMQRIWLRAEQLGLGLQPLQASLSLFGRLDTGVGLQESEIEKLQDLRQMFRSIVNLGENSEEFFLFKISKAKATMTKTKRFPLNEILFMVNEGNQ
jgi:molybdopterin/thiamine biosynthesis adenylyltransferase/nitroreductase